MKYEVGFTFHHILKRRWVRIDRINEDGTIELREAEGPLLWGKLTERELIGLIESSPLNKEQKTMKNIPTNETIQNALDALVGQGVGYGASDARNVVFGILDAYNHANGKQWRGDGFNSVPNKDWTLSIFYCGTYVGKVSIHRKKGATHHGYFREYCDYAYKSFDVSMYPNKPADQSVEDYLASIDGAYAKAKEAKEEKDANDRRIGLEVLEHIMDRYGLTKYQAVSVAKYIYDHYYELTEGV